MYPSYEVFTLFWDDVLLISSDDRIYYVHGLMGLIILHSVFLSLRPDILCSITVMMAMKIILKIFSKLFGVSFEYFPNFVHTAIQMDIN